MTSTTAATPSALVIPLQRNLDVLTLPPREHPPRPRGRYAAVWPHPDHHSTWDAETEGVFTGEDITRHGRRCGCQTCVPAAAAEVAS